MNFGYTLKYILFVTGVCAALATGSLLIENLSKSSEPTLPTQETEVTKQPVYLMVRCPKGGGDVVFNITDDIALRQIYPN